MRARPLASLAVAAALGVAACGGGDKNADSTTTTPSSLEETTTSLVTTTSTTIDPTLKELLLVAEDLPGFKEGTTPPDDVKLFQTCDPAEAPAFKVVYDAPSVDGATFVRGKDDAVSVSSSVISMPADQAEAGLTELLDEKVVACLQKDLQAVVEKDAASGVTVTVKLTPSKASIPGVDQTVLLSGTVTIKASATESLRADLVFLRSSGTIVVLDYGGPMTLTTSAERQKIVAVAGRKLAAAAGGTTSTTEASGGSSTSTSRRTSTTRRSTTSTRSGSSTSSTRRTTTTTGGSTTSTA